MDIRGDCNANHYMTSCVKGQISQLSGSTLYIYYPFVLDVFANVCICSTHCDIYKCFEIKRRNIRSTNSDKTETISENNAPRNMKITTYQMGGIKANDVVALIWQSPQLGPHPNKKEKKIQTPRVQENKCGHWFAAFYYCWATLVIGRRAEQIFHFVPTLNGWIGGTFTIRLSRIVEPTSPGSDWLYGHEMEAVNLAVKLTASLRG